MNTVLEIFGYPNMKWIRIIIIPLLITPIYLIPTLGGRTCRGPIEGSTHRELSEEVHADAQESEVRR